ncbi:prepilin-type N-terminal cleavage/methylation domain-containing protein [Roseateles koreensis]|uniref:Prepilin-type N-terminal cleavage/methylation domain-containing protein n=1 Tax=Roseateles koreensis TaxID=2987526 RepID=A0ABT5KTW3_9BURK|nr:prepilin-type N-terminal cleavage/methylation domain-containing protein [Roseateles koreensis]MDC8786371.1 prepilin-type N-terminal cleavage/methylation domain-containing protein [Roseateles koreensis]
MNALPPRLARTRNSKRRGKSCGFTLLEMAIVIAITGILLAVAIPSYQHMLQRRQLRQVAELLALDLRHARELSVSENSAIFINYNAGKQWCWGLSRAKPCDCAGTSPQGRCELSHMDNTHYPHVLLDAAQDAAFSPGLGQVAQSGAAALRTEAGQNLRVVLNPMGRTHICGPDAVGALRC